MDALEIARMGDTCPDCGHRNHCPYWCPERAYAEGRTVADMMYRGDTANQLAYGYHYYRKRGYLTHGDYERGIADALQPRFEALPAD